MSFAELRFLIFFPTVVAVFLLLPYRFRWMFLLLASYVFYMAFKPSYGLLLFAITCIDYFAGILMGRETRSSRRKLYLVVSLCANLGILFVFKYFNFVFSSFEEVFRFVQHPVSFPTLSIILPIGISFHIFQSLSYTIEVYRKKYEPVTHFGKYALYVSFFPQLAAGPIERPSGLLTQIMEGRRFDLEKAKSGLLLMLWGYCKKLLIADNLAPYVNAVYANPSLYLGPSYIFATILFAYEIYCDFSGYTDIARGAARVFGFDLMVNFNRPFKAVSMADFWRRWHISLSTWLRDYLYLPLAFSGRHRSRGKIYASLFITFVLIGLWHGANWTYVIFGAIHGLLLVIESVLTSPARSLMKTRSMPIFIKQISVFLLVCFSYIFFRAQDTKEALYIVRGLLSNWAAFLSALTNHAGRLHVLAMDQSFRGLYIGLSGVLVLELIEALHERRPFSLRLKGQPIPTRAFIYASAISAILLFGALGSTQQFIYFQF